MNDQKKWRFLAELNGKYVLYRLGLHLFNCIDLERLRRQRKPTPVILAELGIIRWGDMYWFYPPFARQTINRLARRRWIRLVRKKTGGLFIVVTRKGLREIGASDFSKLLPAPSPWPIKKKVIGQLKDDGHGNGNKSETQGNHRCCVIGRCRYHQKRNASGLATPRRHLNRTLIQKDRSHG